MLEVERGIPELRWVDRDHAAVMETDCLLRPLQLQNWDRSCSVLGREVSLEDVVILV